MGWLQRLFSVGRLKREASGQNAGRFLPPASVQRTQLGLAQLDLPAGVVTLRGGEVRAMVAVSGEPVHHRSQEDARAFLQRWARAINAMPAETVWLVRSRAGVLETYLKQKRDHAAALAEREPGSALAKLAADQLAHLRHMATAGDLRRTDNFVAVRDRKGDVAALLQTVRAVEGHLRAAGLRAELLRERRLAEAIADSWVPYIGEMWIPYETEAWRFRVLGHTATVEPAPSGPPEPPAPQPERWRAALSVERHRALSSAASGRPPDSRKALPR